MRQEVRNVLFDAPTEIDTLAPWEAHLKWLMSLPEDWVWREDYISRAQDFIARKRSGELFVDRDWPSPTASLEKWERHLERLLATPDTETLRDDFIRQARETIERKRRDEPAGRGD